MEEGRLEWILEERKRKRTGHQRNRDEKKHGLLRERLVVNNTGI